MVPRRFEPRDGRALRTALLAFALWAPLPAAASGQIIARTDTVASTLMGVVRGRFLDGVRVLPHAVVEATSAAGRHSAVADSLGHYRLFDLPPGRLRIRAAHTGHESVELTVWLPAKGELSLDLELTAVPLELVGVDVNTRIVSPLSSERPIEEGPLPNPDFEVEMLDLSPGVSQAGLANVIQALPGNDPADPTDVLFMRGSTADLKLVLLDGIPVFTPFHVAGLMKSFEPSVLGSADLHVGGAPARYDGGLTHILDLKTRSARRDRVRASGSVDLLAASVATEVPLGTRAGVVASARSLHDLGEVPLGGQKPYGYRDVLVSVDADPRPDHHVRATGFWNAESVRLDFQPAASEAAWSNRAVSLGYRAMIGTTRLELTAGGSGYEATLPLQPSALPNQPLPEALLASAESERARIMAEITWGTVAAPVRAGFAYEDLRVRFTAQNLSGGTRVENPGSSSVLGGFVDVTRPLDRGVTIRAGLRGDLFAGDAVRMAPRASLLWELGPDALLTVTAGRYHQATRSPDGEVEETLAALADREVGPGELLPVATADHVVLSLDQRLGRSVNLGIQGFWKRYDGLRAAAGETVRNSGLDLQVLSAGARGSVWLGYGLSWFWSPHDLSGRSNEFVGRHLLSAGVVGGLGGRLHGEARIAYGAGLPSTSIPFGSSGSADAPGPGLETVSGSSNTGPFDDDFLRGEEFLRIDLELNALFEPIWGGHPWRVRPYVRLLNALDRRDALFYTYQPWLSSAVTPLAERPILPLFGIAFSF